MVRLLVAIILPFALTGCDKDSCTDSACPTGALDKHFNTCCANTMKPDTCYVRFPDGTKQPYGSANNPADEMKLGQAVNNYCCGNPNCSSQNGADMAAPRDLSTPDLSTPDLSIPSMDDLSMMSSPDGPAPDMAMASSDLSSSSSDLSSSSPDLSSPPDLSPMADMCQSTTMPAINGTCAPPAAPCPPGYICLFSAGAPTCHLVCTTTCDCPKNSTCTPPTTGKNYCN